jgi:carbon monoxide dehydrogenase subunit G
MLVEFRERVRMTAPIEAVWNFILDPAKIVACMPGAGLKEVQDDKSFNGTLSVSFGGMSVQFTGHVSYQNIDEAGHTLDMIVVAKQYGGGALNGNIHTRIAALSPQEVEVEVISSADLKGGLVRAGKSMIEAMASEIIKEYIANVEHALEQAAQSAKDGQVGKQPERKTKPLSAWRLLLAVARRRLEAWLERRRA